MAEKAMCEQVDAKVVSASGLASRGIDIQKTYSQNAQQSLAGKHETSMAFTDHPSLNKKHP
jgi:outer membrane lipopolysaccharide assembly protein LptE/RlpB